MPTPTKQPIKYQAPGIRPARSFSGVIDGGGREEGGGGGDPKPGRWNLRGGSILPYLVFSMDFRVVRQKKKKKRKGSPLKRSRWKTPQWLSEIRERVFHGLGSGTAEMPILECTPFDAPWKYHFSFNVGVPTQQHTRHTFDIHLSWFMTRYV